jgi:hypothetical protein
MNRLDLFSRLNRIEWQQFKTRLSWLDFTKNFNLQARWITLQRWYAAMRADIRQKSRLERTKLILLTVFLLLMTCFLSFMMASCMRQVFPNTPAAPTHALITPAGEEIIQPSPTPQPTSTATAVPLPEAK